jgi:hypothetical protein
MGDVEKEWRRLRVRVRREGAVNATRHVANLIRQGGYPVWYPYKLGDYLLKQGELSAVGELLRVVRRFAQPHPLIDKLYGTWLWCLGNREQATRFIRKRAKQWSKSFLYNELSAMYKLEGHEKKAKKCLDIAKLLAERELAKKLQKS